MALLHGWRCDACAACQEYIFEPNAAYECTGVGWVKHGSGRGWVLCDKYCTRFGRIVPYKYGAGWRVAVYDAATQRYPRFAPTKRAARQIILHVERRTDRV